MAREPLGFCSVAVGVRFVEGDNERARCVNLRDTNGVERDALGEARVRLVELAQLNPTLRAREVLRVEKDLIGIQAFEGVNIVSVFGVVPLREDRARRLSVGFVWPFGGDSECHDRGEHHQDNRRNLSQCATR